MLTLKAILKTTRQMTAFGERGTAGALDHLPARVQGQPMKKRVGSSGASGSGSAAGTDVRRWDEEQKTYVHI